MESEVDYGFLQYLRSSRRAREILNRLQQARASGGSILVDDSVDAKAIAKNLRIQQTNAIKYLGDLLRYGAAEEVTSRQRSRRYKITQKGKAALEIVAKE